MTQLIRSLQSDLQAGGFYEGIVDGDWGPLSRAAWAAAMQSARLRCDAQVPSKPPHVAVSLAWSGKVSPAFVDKTIWIASNLRMPAQRNRGQMKA